jgi:signal transduction histidine kinase
LRETEFYSRLVAREENHPVRFEYYHASLKVWTEVRAYPMGGNTALYLVDISGNKRIESDLSRAQRTLEEHAANLERTVADRTAKLQESIGEPERFSYTISHDLRAPLRAMEGFSKFLAEDYGDKLDEQGHECLKRIRDAARRMDALIKDVLVYSKTSRAALKLERIDLDRLIGDIVLEYPSLNASGASIEIKSPLGQVLGNETMLTQALSNLMQNSVKFVKPGETPILKIWTEPCDGRVRLCVQDQGIGVPQNDQSKIFDMFQRAHGGAYEGTGIGLAIVQRAVERMNGVVGFESRVGEGSTFWMELPQS